MAHLLVMPRQGNTVESCVLVRWSIAEGARVAATDVVCEVETDKAAFEVTAGADGVLLKILKGEGEDVPVLEPIAVIGEQGEDWRAALAAGGGGAGPAEPAPPASSGAVPGPPAALAPGLPAAGAGVPAAGAAPRLSPRARRLAAQQAVPTADLAGTGPGGRVIERDVRSALAARPPPRAAAGVAAAGGGQAPAASAGGYSETPLRSVRKIIAERMRGSLATTAQLTFHGSAPAARILALRARFKGSDPDLGLSAVTIGDLVMYAVSRVVPRFPAVNSHLLGSTLRTFQRVHLGFAVDTPRGLMVPVIRNADLLSLAALSDEARRLAAACLGGAISPDELTGATFTVSNLGALGVESFTPVLNVPEVGILGVSAIVPRVAAGEDGQPVLEQRIGLSLTVDHQVVDGAPAARLLKAFSDAVREIDLVWTISAT